MRLRRVTVTGFKTFARRTEVVLERGITAVVGPNGSGKSNLVDAIRWALGETNARELRGARMDEVIHSGGQGRPPMGMASVDIVIDNSEGRLPVEDAEVGISRRVVRNGDSEYRLNGGRIRLRDIERMLSATGLTQNGYAVVAQNDIDGIIEATPAQRRSLVEEAAGVRGLRSAREDGLARVSAVETRLLRLRDLLDDAEPRLEELASQASAAVEQREMAARLAELRGSLAREAWRAARGQARRARQRVTTATARAEAAAEAEAGFAARLEQERRRLEAARAARAEGQRLLEEARIAAERAAGDSRRYEDRAVSFGLQRAASAAEAMAAQRESAEHHLTAEELSGAGSDATALLERLGDQRDALDRAHRDADAALRTAERALVAAGERLAAAERDAAQAAAAVRDLEVRVAVLEENAAGLAASAAAAGTRAADLDRAAALAEERATALAAAATGVAAAASEAAERVALARAEQTRLENEHAATTAQRHEAEARAAALRGQIDGALGGGAIASAVAGGALRATRLVESMQLRSAEDATAIEAALEPHLGAWVVDDLEAAAALLQRGGGREEVLVAGLAVTSAERPPPGVRPAFDALDADERAAGALAHCLVATWLVADLATGRSAVAAAGGRAILPDGTVVTRAGVRGGGRPGETIALAAAERETAASLARLRDAEAASAARVAAATAETATAEEGAERGAAAVDQARAAAGAATAEAMAARGAATAERDRSIGLDRDRASRESAAADARMAAGAAMHDSAVAAERVADAATAAAAATAERERAAVTLAAAEAAVRAHDIEVARAEPAARDVQRRLAGARGAAEQAAQRLRVAELRLVAAEESSLAALARAIDCGAGAVRADAAVTAAAGTAAASAAPTEALELSVRSLETERSEVAVAAARAADELQAATAEMSAAEERVAELAEAVRDDELDEGPEPDAAAAEKAEREIARLERRIAALGPVNGLAPEQHALLATRVERLHADHDDLAGACRDVRALADHLSGEIQDRFDAVFGAVAYHFRLLFEELFPGGRATLRLEEPRFELESPDDEDTAVGARRAARGPQPPGVEILAQPAGKRLQSLSLLSGGERALTALAVILALQHVNPSPFYIFDEVDAPLDDANIGRFTRLLRRLSAEQQFLVVTHNHATMAAADALYGVTMGNDGISRLISVRFVAGEPVPHERSQAEDAVRAS